VSSRFASLLSCLWNSFCSRSRGLRLAIVLPSADQSVLGLIWMRWSFRPESDVVEYHRFTAVKDEGPFNFGEGASSRHSMNYY